MSHLGERVSALVDGELNHTERDRALAHLTFCADCRREVESVRALKSRLRSLETPAMPADLTMSLLRMAEPGGPLPPRERPFPTRTFGGVPIPGPHTIAPLDNRPRRDASGGASGPGRGGSRRRSAYVAVGVVSAAVAIGTFFATTGIGQNNPAPPVELFQQQARTTPTNGSSTATP